MLKTFSIVILCIIIGTVIIAGDAAELKTATKTEAKQAIKATFIELGSVRCIPCKKMLPIIEEIKKEYAGQVKVIFHDVWTDEGKPFAKVFGIKMIPTQVFLDKDGKEYYRHVGFLSKKKLVEQLQRQGVK